MRNYLLQILLMSSVVGGVALGTSHAWAQSGKTKAAQKSQKNQKAAAKTNKKKAQTVQKTPAVKTTTAKTTTVSDRFKQFRGDYNAGRITSGSAWGKLEQFEDRAKSLSKPLHASLYQMQSDVLMKEGYPVLASIYAAEAIKMHPVAMSDDLSRSWSILKLITRQKPLQLLTDEMALVIKTDDKVPHFKRDWYYFIGNAEQSKGRLENAIANYSKLRMDDRYFLSAKYQKAMLLVEMDQPKKAVTELNSILTVMAETKPNINAFEKQRIWDLTNLALGRVYYQLEEFDKSIVHFRKVNREGEYFYDSLFEQSWAFFMAGYPSHALGTLHGVESPFFKNVFNPEASMLKSIVFYWMCRYDDSRNALADFMENHSKAVEALGVFLNRQRLSPQTSYQLFEDMVSGVSSESLGIPREILTSAAEQERMMLLRDQYAHAYYELDRLSGVGIGGGNRNAKNARAKLRSYISNLKDEIGQAYIAELTDMKATFERLYDQAQFLYIELLMSEKEKVLGRELHASSKLTEAHSDKKVRGWGKKTMAWDVDEKNEFWWDEVGFHIYEIEPQCNAN